MSDHRAPMNVGIVELSDDGIEVLGQYTRDPQWHVALVASRDHKAKAARMAGLLDARLVEDPTLDDLAECSRVILGHQGALSRSVIHTLRSRGVEVFVWNGDQATPRADSTDVVPLGEVNFPSGSSDGLSREGLEWSAFAGPGDEESESADEAPGDSFEDSDLKETEETEEIEVTPEAGEESEVMALGSQDVEPLEDRAEPPTADVPSSKEPAHSSIWSAPVAPDTRDLRDLLENVREATQAQTASLMVPVADGSALHLEASLGFERYGEAPGPECRSGLAWDCFRVGEPRWNAAHVPGLAEWAGPATQRVSISVPILSERRVMGVININRDTAEKVSMEDLVEVMQPFAGVAARTLIKSVDFSSLTAEELCQQLMQVVDRIMSFDENLAVRLQDAADVIVRAVDGDEAHVLLVDSMGRRLEWVGSARGMRGAQWTDVDRGFLGWALHQEVPQVLEAVSRDGSERRANAYMPILSTYPCGLLVLENLKLGRFERNDLVFVLENVGNLLGEVLNVAEGMGTQELMSDMKMRILDASSGLEAADPEERAHGLLSLAVDLTAACTAMWVPAPGARPLVLKPTSEASERIVSQSLFSLDTLTDLTLEHGAWSWGMGAEESVTLPSGATLPAPVAAMREREGSGVLLVFFTEAEARAFTAQMPMEMLDEVMRSVLDLMHVSKAA